MINKKYFILFILMSVLLIISFAAYAEISGYDVKISQKSILKIQKDISNSKEGVKDNFIFSITRDTGHNGNVPGSNSAVSGLSVLNSVQNLNSPEFFLFQGFIGEDSEFSIEPANVENETEQQDSEYRAEFLDAENNLLKVFNFSAEEIEYSDYKTFYFFAEFPVSAEKIVFYDNQKILNEFVISEHSPVVSNVEVDEAGEDELEIIWKAEDADGDNLAFSVFINNGSEIYIVGDLIEDNFFTLKTDFIMGGDYKVIVRAFDGFNFGYGESDFFSVSEKKPYLIILGIDDNSEFLLNQEIHASASGFDLEDGFLDNFSWRLNGEEISLENSIALSGLSLGEYELTLEAEDSDGNAGTESIAFSVVETLNTWCNGSDITKDGTIDANDYDVIDKIWLFYRNTVCSSNNNWCNNADINRDSRIDANDYDKIDKTYLFADDSGRCTRLF